VGEGSGMRLTRDDLGEMFASQNKPCLHTKEEEREELERLTQEFLRRGGEIQRVGRGITAPELNRMVITGMATDADHAQRILKRAKRASEKYHRESAGAAEVGTYAAAKILGIGVRTLQGMIERNEGPPFELVGRIRPLRRFDRARLAAWGQENGYTLQEEAA